MTEQDEGRDDDTSVRVALRVRPQLARERIDMCQVCTTVMEHEKQVIMGKDKAFTFDFVYDMNSTQNYIYENCVEKLIDGCFEGYNATVVAYGQTGSGKTYTMGTGFEVNTPEVEIGIIPRAVDHLFRGIDQRRQTALDNNEPPPDFKVNAQFMELYNEEILDLLDTTRDAEIKHRKSNAKIHEDAEGGIYVVGITTRLVHSLQETMQCLESGALSRSTASTNMNATSSRSHAIFTLHIKQHRVVKEPLILDDEDNLENGETTEDNNKDIDSNQSNEGIDSNQVVKSAGTTNLEEFETLTAKFHFVDLAGSERLKRTGATGDRAKEGISINCGLLALGNVISALGDRLKKGSHVPYRDSKLTRLLQDSLGGNSRTLMIACVSPSDRDFMETLNTLKYANRARNIKNKVIANQDKASKQLSILRQEITELQQELLEYRTGRRVLDNEGAETPSDVFLENNMLQSENEKLRTRIKSLNDTVEKLTARNSQLLADQALMNLGNAAGDATNEEVVNLIKGYVKELEELRAKLAESEAMSDRLKRSRQLSTSRMAVSPGHSGMMSSMMSPIPGSMSTLSTSMSMSQSYEVPESPDNQICTILDEAKKDLRKLKKMKSRSKLNQDSDKENHGSDEEKAREEAAEKAATDKPEASADKLAFADKPRLMADKPQAVGDQEDEMVGEIEEKDRSEKSEKDVDENGNLDHESELDEESNLDEDDDDLDEEIPDSSTDSDSDTDGKDSDNIHEDLAELTCEISIKQRLIEELEQSQKRLHAMKTQYEDKVCVLMTKIRETEAERDKVLSNIGKADSNKSEQSQQTKKVKEQYERKLNEMQNDLKKLNAAKKEHAKLVKNQSHYERQLKTLQHELGEMKKTKVRLMKQMKEDAEKSKQFELRKNKEMAQLKKEHMKREGLIRTLENQKRQKDMVLKRKQEEVELLRKKNRPMSSQTAGRMANYPQRQPVINRAPLYTSSPSRYRRRRGQFSAKSAKNKWTAIEKNVSSVINKKQTIGNIEKDMDVWLKYREKLCKKMEKCQKKKETMVALIRDETEIKDVTDLIQSLQSQVQFAQENINECQSNIVQVEESKEETGSMDHKSMVESVSLDEAKYLLEHFITMSIAKGVSLASKESENRELMAKLHQTELNNTLQEDLLKHMMADRVDIEVDNLMTNQMDDMDSSTSSSSSSPVDRSRRQTLNRMFESRVEPILNQKPAGSGSAPMGVVAQLSASWDAASARRDKRTVTVDRTSWKTISQTRPARRRTATPDDLLYASNEEPVPSLLNTVPETTDETMHPPTAAPGPNASKIPAVMTMSAPPGTSSMLISSNTSAEGTLMPPPKSLPPPRQTSASRLPSVSPSLRRKDYSKPSPSPSPVLRRKNSFTLIPRSNSTDCATSSDTTPPSSPTPSRRTINTDTNVFSRLTSNTAGISDLNSKRGSIIPASNRLSMRQSGPLVCSHTAEGHTKAVLSVAATEDLLFTSSKDRSAKCWDLHEGREILSFTGHPNTVSVVRYCPQLHLVFTVSQSYISVWDIREYTSKCIKTLSSSGLTQDGQVNSSSLQIELPSGEHHINDIALNCTGSLLYSASGSVVRVWDLRRFAAVGKLSGGHQAAIMVLGVDNYEDRDVVITGSKDHYIKVFEVMSEGAGVLTPKYNLEPPHYDGIQSLAIQGHSLFSGSRDTCIKKWDLHKQSLVQSVNSAHKDWICALNFMKGSNTLLSGCRGGYLKLWNSDTCAQITEIRAHTSPINAIATNSQAIFTASNDNTVRMWHYKTGSQELTTEVSDTNHTGALSSSTASDKTSDKNTTSIITNNNTTR